MTQTRAAILVAAAGLAGVATALVLAPEYFASRGVPFDDAWVHAVYARSLARSGTLAFNPGVPSTGATSTLWTLMAAVPHAVTFTLCFCVMVAPAACVVAVVPR